MGQRTITITVTKQVIELRSMPLDLVIPDWLEKSPDCAYIECHIEDENLDEVSEWLKKTFPGLEREESFFIYIG